MTDITFSVDRGGQVSGSESVSLGGFVGDHNSIRLTFMLDDGFCPDADYYRLHFEGYMSEELYASDGTVSYTLPQALTCTEHLPLQLKAYRTDDREIRVIAHSHIISLCLSGSLDSTKTVDPAALDMLDVLAGNARAAADSAKTSADNALLYTNRARIYADDAENYSAIARGAVISSAAVNTDGHLIVTYADTSVVDAGTVKGDKGDPPVRGIDYWTDADVAAMQEYMDRLFNDEVTEALEGEY